MLRRVTSRAAVSCAVEVGLELAATTSRNQDTGLDRSTGVPGEDIIVQNTEYYAVALLFGTSGAARSAGVSCRAGTTGSRPSRIDGEERTADIGQARMPASGTTDSGDDEPH